MMYFVAIDKEALTDHANNSGNPKIHSGIVHSVDLDQTDCPKLSIIWAW